jgi:hypothetical protein
MNPIVPVQSMRSAIGSTMRHSRTLNERLARLLDPNQGFAFLYDSRIVRTDYLAIVKRNNAKSDREMSSLRITSKENRTPRKGVKCYAASQKP